jgi:multiple sugar transport system substrate-binding protein
MKRIVRFAPHALALVLMASMALSACAPAPEPAQPQAPAPAATAKAPEATKAASPSDKPVTLTLWGGFPEMEPFYKYVAEAYKKEHPNVTVEVLTHPLREFEQKLSATIPSDTASDIIEISMYANQKFIEAGLIPELPANVKAFMDEKGRYSDFLHANNTYKGKKYGLPLFVGRTALYWNKDMFKEAGLDGPPKTQKEAAEFAKKLAKSDAAGTLTRAGHSLRLSGQGSGVAEKWWFILWPLGGTIVKDAGNGKYCAGYNNDAGRQALKFYIDAVHVDKYDSHALKHDAEAFELGLAAMLLRESWVIGDIAKKAPNLNYDTAAVPSAERWGRITNPVNLYVTRSAKNPDVAWDFAMFMMKPEHMNWLLEKVGWLPAREDVDLSAVLTKIPQFKAFVMKDPKYEEYGYPVIAPFDEIMTKLAERLVAAYLDKSLANNADGIAKTIDAAATETNEILKKAGLYAECK